MGKKYESPKWLNDLRRKILGNKSTSGNYKNLNTNCLKN